MSFPASIWIYDANAGSFMLINLFSPAGIMPWLFWSGSWAGTAKPPSGCLYYSVPEADLKSDLLKGANIKISKHLENCSYSYENFPYLKF